MHIVAVTRAFERQAEDAGMSPDEVNSVIDLLARDPSMGDITPGIGDCRKIRVAGRGKGKSGGNRVITFFAARAPARLPACGFRQGRKGEPHEG